MSAEQLNNHVAHTRAQQSDKVKSIYLTAQQSRQITAAQYLFCDHWRHRTFCDAYAILTT